jgi:hypothetical protein
VLILQLSAGWNTDYGKNKFSITVTEEEDLTSMLADAGLPPDARHQLTNRQKFFLLHVEAEIFCMEAAIKHNAIPEAEGRPKLASLQAERQRYTSALPGAILRGPAVPVSSAGSPGTGPDPGDVLDGYTGQQL